MTDSGGVHDRRAEEQAAALWTVEVGFLACAEVLIEDEVAVVAADLGVVVKDEQGGVLPGTTVTISSPQLIGGAQVAVTG